jgi:hypothetical protein
LIALQTEEDRKEKGAKKVNGSYLGEREGERDFFASGDFDLAPSLFPDFDLWRETKKIESIGKK